MNRYDRSHLGDAPLLAQMGNHCRDNRQSNAGLIADIGEVDERKLYLPVPYPSMYSFLVADYHMSEDLACKRITVARKAREFPVIFEMIADGRQHLSGLVMLAPHLETENRAAAEALLAAAAYQSKSEILKRHLRGPEAPTPPMPGLPSSPTPAESQSSAAMPEASQLSSAEGPFELSAPGRIDVHASALRKGQLDLDEETEQMLEYAQSLLGHQIPPGDLAKLVRKLLDVAIPQLEKRKFGANSRARRAQSCSSSPRHIPVSVKCTVWRRDGGSARSRANPASAVRRGHHSSSITSWRWRAAGHQPWKTFVCAVAGTISTRRKRPSELDSCSRSARKLSASRRKGAPRSRWRPPKTRSSPMT